MIQPSAISAILGAIVGGVLGIVGSLSSQWYNKRVRKKRLKRALIAEIESMEYTLNKLDDRAEDENLPRAAMDANVPTRVYESNAGQLGLFDEDTVKAVVDFYSHILRIKYAFRKLNERRSEFDDITEADEGTQMEVEAIKMVLKAMAETVREQRNEALDQLKKSS